MCWSLSHRPRGEFSAILTIWFGSKLSIHHFQKQSLTIDLILSESMAGFVSELMVVFNRCGWSVWCLIHAVILAIANIYLFEGMGKNSQFEELQTFELELIEFRDTLLKIAQDYHPSHDDGVQITAAPLWPLFRHKPWQKVLKDTWTKLEKGDYDWAHLAMNYWPNRVREKCKTDKSLAIAHGLEELYIEPEAKSKKVRGNKSKTSSESNF